jgi:UDP-3-O-[3-hydroxymyristoyl] glucosamine N-acyltransferase
VPLRDIGIDSDYTVESVSSFLDLKSNSMLFLENSYEADLKQLHSIKESLIIMTKEKYQDYNEILRKVGNDNYILQSEKPRATYVLNLYKILEVSKFFEKYKGTNYRRNSGSFISTVNVDIDPTAQLGDGVLVGPDTKIGAYSKIDSGVKINGNVHIGNHVSVGYNSVIGHPGFGFIKDNGKWLRMPHLGGVVLSDGVEIGCLTTVVSGAIHPTFVGEGTKVDDHVHIGHNARIGKNCVITACAEMGRMVMGDRVWIGPNTSIMQGIEIQDDAYVGMASNVTKSVAASSTVAGNPADTIDNLKKIRSFLKESILTNSRSI